MATETADQILVLANVVVLLISIALIGWLITHPLDEERAYENNFVRVTWGTLVLAIVLTALLDVHLTFPNQPLAWLLRPIHVLAFTSWIGGAVWNIFIAVPGAQATLSVEERKEWTLALAMVSLYDSER